MLKLLKFLLISNEILSNKNCDKLILEGIGKATSGTITKTKFVSWQNLELI